MISLEYVLIFLLLVSCSFAVAHASAKDSHLPGNRRSLKISVALNAPHRSNNRGLDPQQLDRLKYKFPLEFAERTHPERSIFGPEELQIVQKYGPFFKVFSSKPKGAIESFRYYLRYDVYPLKTFNGSQELFLLLASSGGLDGMVEAFLLDNGENGHKMLDYLSLDPRNDNKFSFLKLAGHAVISFRQSIHGTGYLDEQEKLIGIIHKKFHKLFSTDLLEANDWALSDSGNPDLFDRRLAQIEYVHENGDSVPDIREEVSVDVVNVSADSATFRNAPITKHIRSWVEIYDWDKKTDTFKLEKRYGGSN